MGRKFSDIFRDLRQEKSLTQAELAKKLNYTQGNISGWENGSVEPKATALLIIAEFFNVSADYLLGLEDDFGGRISAGTATVADVMRDTNTAQERELLELFRTLSPYLQGLTLDTVRGWAGGASDKSLHKKA